MKTFKIALIFLIFLSSCIKKKEPCEEYSEPYYSSKLINFSYQYHNTKIKGENITIRNSFEKLISQEHNIIPENGMIILKIHIDKFGVFCNQENFQIDENYQPVSFNNGELIKKIETVSSNLSGWQNDTETKTFYLIRLKIKDGIIKEIF
ncbi:hypothetical protein F7018_00630 [Tenacibaculum aiptasiae]|uniref:Lipoprotein n=1 Tax=Tenacibaculum aiptasiae TaxID=426481 RepID=A0A7J5ASA0_9FLAO|nr:hypothetical protein [Tenacibaculum aiptasiae]KAB1160414.1 hypothetical protein F7018_00630 [Tenacibaculum aiptasiae]